MFVKLNSEDRKHLVRKRVDPIYTDIRFCLRIKFGEK